MKNENEKVLLPRRTFLSGAAIVGVGATITEIGHQLQVKVYEAVMADRLDPRPLIHDTYDHELFFGVTPDPSWFQNIATTTETFGRYPDVTNVFLYGYGYGNSLNERETWRVIQTTNQLEKTSMVSWGDRVSLWEDRFFMQKEKANLVVSMLQRGGKVIFRLWYEMNGFWAQKWYGILSPAQFITAWRNMYALIRSKDPEGKIRVCWCPNARTNLRIDRIELYYPGDAYVDCIGLDVYNKHSINPFWIDRHIFTPDLTPYEAVGPEIAVIQQLTKKPWFIAEANIQREIHRYEWIQQLMELVEKTGGIGFMPFLLNKPKEHNWNDPEVIAAVSDRIRIDRYRRRE